MTLFSGILDDEVLSLTTDEKHPTAVTRLNDLKKIIAQGKISQSFNSAVEIKEFLSEWVADSKSIDTESDIKRPKTEDNIAVYEKWPLVQVRKRC